ncbi:MAG: hypothetical protein JO145_04860 [Acidobacteriaceae bacterium]|nr:hypothetical protein [Acidobacteriaceae bacterium]MBV9763341.1 hypothetical protein [Acidobacteriaceae bacterium]
MDQKVNQSQSNVPENQDLENRRDVVRRLGKYAVYAAPFTLLSKASAIGGTGSSSGPSRAKPKH